MSYQFNYASKPVNQALPAGWEAKYDPTNRKWFYINHFTKTTQWNDPRLTMQVLHCKHKLPYLQYTILECRLIRDRCIFVLSFKIVWF